MKIVTREQQDAAAKAAFQGAAKGGSLGLAAFIPAFYLAGRRFPAVARLPTVQKGFLGLIAFLGAGATNAEFAYQRFLASEWKGSTADALRQEAEEKQDEWVSMSPKEKTIRWAIDNRYKVVAGAWVASMLGSAGFIFARNPTQTFSQKLVQCRMVAQGATVAVLIASAGLSRISFDDHDPLAEQREAEAHSWEHMIDVQPEKTPALGSVHPSHAPAGSK